MLENGFKATNSESCVLGEININNLIWIGQSHRLESLTFKKKLSSTFEMTTYFLK